MMRELRTMKDSPGASSSKLLHLILPVTYTVIK